MRVGDNNDDNCCCSPCCCFFFGILLGLIIFGHHKAKASLAKENPTPTDHPIKKDAMMLKIDQHIYDHQWISDHKMILGIILASCLVTLVGGGIGLFLFMEKNKHNSTEPGHQESNPNTQSLLPCNTLK